jgi:hypothetical protein
MEKLEGKKMENLKQKLMELYVDKRRLKTRDTEKYIKETLDEEIRGNEEFYNPFFSGEEKFFLEDRTVKLMKELKKLPERVELDNCRSTVHPAAYAFWSFFESAKKGQGIAQRVLELTEKAKKFYEKSYPRLPGHVSKEMDWFSSNLYWISKMYSRDSINEALDVIGEYKKDYDLMKYVAHTFRTVVYHYHEFITPANENKCVKAVKRLIDKYKNSPRFENILGDFGRYIDAYAISFGGRYHDVVKQGKIDLPVDLINLYIDNHGKDGEILNRSFKKRGFVDKHMEKLK